MTALRLADWRFLLSLPPTGRFGRVAALGPAGFAELLRAVGVADEVLAELPSDESVDAVVVLPPAIAQATAIAGALRPGGQLYLECVRVRGVGPAPSLATLRSELEGNGLVVTGSYAALPPDASAARRYVPLDAPAALRWYFHNTYRPLSMRMWATALAAPMMLAGRGARFRTLVRTRTDFVITARRDGSVPPVRAAWYQQVVPDLPGTTRVVMFADGGDRVVLMPFAPEDAEPRFVIKVPRIPSYAARTRGEREQVITLRALLPAALRRALPEPTQLATYGSFTIAAERATPGRMLIASTGSWGAGVRRRLQDLRLAMDWLSRFHQATLVRRAPWGDVDGVELIEQPAAEYAAHFGETTVEAALFARARRYAESLQGEAMCTAWQHGDYAVWNLLRHESELHVLDWEGARIGPAVIDAIHFITSWDLAIRGGAGLEAELRSFSGLFLDRAPRDVYVRAARAALRGYLGSLGLSARLMPILLLHHRLELALRRWRQQRDADPADPADPDAAALPGRGHSAPARRDSREVEYIALLARHADRLFGAGGPGTAGQRTVAS